MMTTEDIHTERPQLPEYMPTDGRFVVGGGLTYSDKMLEPMAEFIGGLPGVTDVDTITFKDAMDDPDNFRDMVRGAHLLGHSAMGVAYSEAKPEGILSATMVDTVEPRPIPQLLGGAVLLNAHQTGEALFGDKKDRWPDARAVGGKAWELAAHYLPTGFLFRALPVISRTSTLEALENTRNAEPRIPLRLIFMQHGEFKFGLSDKRTEEAWAKSIQVYTLLGDRMTHERPVTRPDEVGPKLFPKPAA